MHPDHATSVLEPSPQVRQGVRRRLVLATITLMGLMLGLALIAYAIFAELEARMASLATSNLEEISRVIKAHSDSDVLLKLVNQMSGSDTVGELDPIAYEARALIGRLRGYQDGLATLLPDPAGDLGTVLSPIRPPVEESELAVVHLEQVHRKAIAARQRRLAVSREIDRRFSTLFAVATRVDAHMRALASRALAIDLPDAAENDQLQQRLDSFLENEMSWLGTAQDLLVAARELHSLAARMQFTGNREELRRLQKQTEIYSIRLRVYRLLPHSGAVMELPAVVQAFVFPISGLADLRSKELELYKRSTNATRTAVAAAEALEAVTRSLLPKMMRHTHETVNDTRQDIENAQLLLFTTVLSIMLFTYLAFTRYIGTRIIDRLENFTNSMKSAAAAASINTFRNCQPAVPVDVLDVGTRDEVTAMGEALEVFRRAIANRENALQGALEEKEILLREVHHRVKNNMQVIASLLHLQAGRAHNEVAQGILRDSQLRVKSMAIAHEVLYRSRNFARLNLPEYISRLIASVQQMFTTGTSRIRVQTQIEDLPASMDQAIPLGLIINELVTNALKYAFPDGRSGTLMVSLSRRGENETALLISDDGIGLPDDLDWRRTDTLGLVLVSDLCRQIRGTVSLDNSRGVSWAIVFHGETR